MEWMKYILAMLFGGCLLLMFGRKGNGRDKWIMGFGAGTCLASMELTVEYMFGMWKEDSMAKRKGCYSGIGGQAVLEGVMMKNGDKYAVAVRKPDGGIDFNVENYPGVLAGNKLKKIPFVRGIFNFVDSMILGTRCLNYSASFYEEEEEETGVDKALDKVSGGNGEKVLTTFVTILSVAMAVGIFIVLPYFLSGLLKDYIRNESLMTIIEGGIRIAIFILYILAISLMKDIRRLFMYHGAEHKTIFCYEAGLPLTVENVRVQPRHHPRCGTSFLFVVICVSIIFSSIFFGIWPITNAWLRTAVHLLLLPLVVGVTYEFNRWVGRHVQEEKAIHV